jgi:hypothetical protein
MHLATKKFPFTAKFIKLLSLAYKQIKSVTSKGGRKIVMNVELAFSRVFF